MSDKSRKRGMGMWIAVIGCVIVLLVVTPIVVGMLLPEKFSFDVEHRIDATPEVVWAALQDPEQYPVCAGQCRGVRMLEPGDAGPRWVEDLGQTEVTYQVVESEPPTRIVTEGVDSVVPLSYRSETTLEAVDGGTLVRMHVDGRIASGTWHVPLFRLIIHSGGIKSGFRKHLEQVGAGVSG